MKNENGHEEYVLAKFITLHNRKTVTMAPNSDNHTKNTTSTLTTVVELSEEQRLLQGIYRPDMKKLQLFTQMLRTNTLLKRAKITHK